MSAIIDGRLNLLASVVESSNDAMISLTLDGIVRTWNPAAEKIYGYSSEEMIGKPITNLSREDRLAELTIIWGKVRNGQLVPHFETIGVRKDGSTIVISLSISPIYDADGEIIGMSSVGYDVTELKTAIEHLRSLIEASPRLLVTTNVEGKITDANLAASKITGIAREELIGSDFSDYFTEPKEAREVYQRVFAEGRVIDYPLTIRHRDGVLTNILYTATVYRDAQGKVLGVFASTSDVTVQKRGAEYARSLIEASLDPLVTISVEGKITDVNEATVMITGIARDGLIGTDFSDYFTEPDEARKGYQRVFAEKKVSDFPLTIRHRGGVLTDVLYNASVYCDPWNNVLGVFAAARDVTEQKRVQAMIAEQEGKELQRLVEHDRLEELERFQRLIVGRELKMIEMKAEIENLKRLLPADIGGSEDER